MGLFSWLNDRAFSSMIVPTTKQKVHIMWQQYKALADQNLTEAEKWQRAVELRLQYKTNHAALLKFEDVKSSITNFVEACLFICEIEVFRNGQYEPTSQQHLDMHGTILLETQEIIENFK